MRKPFAGRAVLHRRAGATMVEYSLMVALVAALLMLTVVALGRTLKSHFGQTVTIIAEVNDNAAAAAAAGG